MSGQDDLAALVGPEFAQRITDAHRDAIEDGVRMGLGMAATMMDETASRIGNAAQQDALRGVATGIRITSAGFTLQGRAS